MVIIISQKDDIHALSVKREIELLGRKCIIVDASEYPDSVLIDICIGTQNKSKYTLNDPMHNTIALSDVVGVWRRKIYRHKVSDDLDSMHGAISLSDSKDGLDGFFLVLASTGCNIINNPIEEAASLNKIYQLKRATEVGLIIPETLITNNSATAKSFIEKFDKKGKRVIYKGFSSPADVVTTTNFINQEDLVRLDDLRYAPAIFQEYIGGKNLRVTYVKGSIFSAEVIVSIPEAVRDWRIEVYNKVIPFGLSSTQRKIINKLMKSLKLNYGALDFKLNDNNELVFLEVNPWGQFLFVEIQTGLPISKAIASALIS